tara:strand:- start:9265 stop:9963 length:699 start_codon:yes stop_codon:yes gene_type:complete
MKKVEDGKMKVVSHQMAKFNRLKEELTLNEELWKDDPDIDFEELKKITLINAVPYADTLILYPTRKSEHKTKGGIIIPETAQQDGADISFAMVVAISPKAQDKLDFPCKLGSMLLFNKAFLVKEISFHDQSFYIVQPHAILFKVPTSEIRNMIVTEDPLAVFHPEIIDMANPHEAAKVGDKSMPSGMVEGDQEEQINPQLNAEIKGIEKADSKIQHQVKKPSIESTERPKKQ